MAVGFVRILGTSGIPIWQGVHKDIQLAQGGFELAATGLPAGSVIPAGTPVVFDEAARTATIVGGAVLFAPATNVATAYQVAKGHTLIVGSNLATGATGGAAEAITVIDMSPSDHDVLTVGTTLGVALAAGANLFASSAAGANASAYPAVNGLLYDDTLAVAGESISVVIRGTVYARRIAFAYSAALAALAGLKNIVFSQSK